VWLRMSQEYSKIIEMTLKQSADRLIISEVRDSKQIQIFIQASKSVETGRRNVSCTETNPN
jgi:hypothetical protein